MEGAARGYFLWGEKSGLFVFVFYGSQTDWGCICRSITGTANKGALRRGLNIECPRKRQLIRHGASLPSPRPPSPPRSCTRTYTRYGDASRAGGASQPPPRRNHRSPFSTPRLGWYEESRSGPRAAVQCTQVVISWRKVNGRGPAGHGADLAGYRRLCHAHAWAAREGRGAAAPLPNGTQHAYRLQVSLNGREGGRGREKCRQKRGTPKHRPKHV